MEKKQQLDEPEKVKKRVVFYLSGFDPRGARHYYNIYKKEALRNNEFERMSLNVSKRHRENNFIQTWNIISSLSAQEEDVVTTKYCFLEWNDIVIKRWKESVFEHVIGFFIYIHTYIFSSLFLRNSKLSPTGLKSYLYPMAYVMGSFLLSYITFIVFVYILEGVLSSYLYYSIATFFAYICIYYVLKIGDKLGAFWLLRIYIFSGKYFKEDDFELEQRIEDFSYYLIYTLEEAEENNIDEVLIIAHSIGSILLISVLDNIIRRFESNPLYLKRISIMTLGESIPLISFQKEAIEYKKSMQRVGTSNLAWIDYTSPIDELCFPLVDFFKESGIELKDDEGAEILSPRFHTLYEKDRYAEICKDKVLAHFLYFMASDKVGKYDYFKITAGNQRLKDCIK